MDLSLGCDKKMKPDETVSKSVSPLDKPMWQLTEEDISQLTREDCRRFLRDKGMRRPSWNKSQAIEQVISLKTLLEPGKPDSDANVGSRLKLSLSRPPPEDSPQISSRGKEKVGDVQAIATVPVQTKNDPESDNAGHMLVAVPDLVRATNNNSNRDMNSTNEMVGQMTIFYCGKVNVYNGISASKALAIMQLAASQGNVPQDSPLGKTAAIQLYPCQSQAASIRSGFPFPSAYNVGAESFQQFQEEVTPSRELEAEGSLSRKASVQRYLEKRKDRGKFKNKRRIESSSSLEMYLNHQLRDQNPNEQSSHSSQCTLPLTRPPLTPRRCKSVLLSIDLNGNDISAAREA